MGRCSVYSSPQKGFKFFHTVAVLQCRSTQDIQYQMCLVLHGSRTPGQSLGFTLLAYCDGVWFNSNKDGLRDLPILGAKVAQLCSFLCPRWALGPEHTQSTVAHLTRQQPRVARWAASKKCGKLAPASGAFRSYLGAHIAKHFGWSAMGNF